MNITLLGCGRWGSFIAWYLDKIGHNVTIWGLSDAPQFIEIRDTRKNNMLTFRESIQMTDNLESAVASADVMIISISSQAVRSFIPRVAALDIKGKKIVLCMKGIEVSTGKRLTEIVEEFVTEETPVAVWVGPGHPQDFSNGIPNCMVIDSRHDDLKHETREISRLIKAMGGNELSAYGLCHLGDYEATLFSKYSHNRRFGEMLVNGEKFDKLAEGVDTTKALVYLGQKYNVDLPICQTVYNVITGKTTAKNGLSDLFLRSIKTEF